MTRDHVEPDVQRLLERYSFAVDVCGDGIWEYPAIDRAEATSRDAPVYYSPRFYEMLGYSEDEFPPVAQSWWKIIHPDDVAIATRTIADHLAGKTPRMFCEYRVYDRQGEIRWWHIYGTTIPDSVPGRLRAVGVARDISDLKRAEQQVRDQLELITRQQTAIRSMSTPIIQLWDDIITLPLVGAMTSERAAEIMDRLLTEIVRLRATRAIVDLTGVDIVDTSTAEQLFRITRAVALLGARVLLSGLTPGVAQTLVELGVDISPFATHRNLQEALQACLREPGRQGPRAAR